MNYRHIFHAGNICDVVKHAIFSLVIRHLRSKDKGFFVLDTHAGTGFYDLMAENSVKTGEATSGIKQLLAHDSIIKHPLLSDYTGVLQKMNPMWTGESPECIRIYPGSPMLAFGLLREQDRLAACELHPEDSQKLQLQAPNDKRFQVHCRDGYGAMKALLPPQEKRGVVLIDPPYEKSDEFDAVYNALTSAYQRWPTGIYMVWYPIKDVPQIWQFHEKLAQANIPKILCADFMYDEINAARLHGSGMIIINPPWKLEEDILILFDLLRTALVPDKGRFTVKQLAN